MRGEQMALHFCRSSTLTHTHTHKAHSALPCQTYDEEGLLTSMIVSLRSVSSPLFGHSPWRWGGRLLRKNRKQLTWNPWVMLTWCLLIAGCPGSRTHSQGRCLTITLSCRAIARLQRLLYDLGHTWSWPCDGVEYLFFWQDHAYNITIRIKCDHFKG